MAQQMTPDADLRRRLDERLVAEPSQPAHSSQPARSQPAQPSRQPARVTMMPRSRWSRPATWVAAAAAVVLGVTVTSTLMLRGGTPRDAPATLAAPVAPVPADYSELYRAVAAAINTSDDGPPRQPGPQPQVSGPDREASLPQLDGNPPANDYTGDADEAAREPSDHTTTNTQVDGIDEADLVKTDGTTLYVVTGHDVALVKLAGPATRTLAHINITNPCPGCTVVDLLVHDGTLVVITEDEAYVDPSRGINPYYLSPDTRVLTYDVSDPISPRLRTTTRQSGQYRTARLSQAMVYVVSDYTVWPGWLNPDDPTTFVPSLGTPGEPLAPTDITVLPGPAGARYAVATATDVATGQRTAQQAVLGGADTVYMSAANLYMGGTSAPGRMLCCARAPVDEVRRDTTGPTTALVRMSLRGKALTVEAYGHVPGQLLNQFSLDEHDNRLRVVTTATNDTWQDVAQLYVLGPDLRRVGMTTLATNEQVKSVRFAGTVGYVVTFRQTDPLFAVDLSDPAHPQVMSELKIPGFSAYLHPWGEGHL
ncbi:MAG: beta-propeller domain-containing protein, partial [Micrococcales bacterium]|nr:beta-propeller domain-containing protein [Micrococcales bacterium]